MTSKSSLLSALEFLNPKSLKNLSSTVLILVETKLWAKVLAGMFLGALFGMSVSEIGPFSSIIHDNKIVVESLMSWLVFPAKFFLKLIKMVIIPLIFSSIITGLASTTDVSQMKKLGGRFTLFVLGNSFLAATIGILLANLFAPGRGLSLGKHLKVDPAASLGSDSIFSFGPDSLLNILPINPLSSFVEGQMLDVVILSIITGIALLSIEKAQANSMMDILSVIQQICMKVISWAMKLAPYAVFGMIAQVTSSTGLQSLKNMFVYVLVCFIGFFTLIVFYSLLIYFFKKVPPLVYLKQISTPLLLAFSTSSSAATMPVSLKVAEDELDIDPTSARFLIPLGSTVNMAGSCIWHTSAVIFISQAYDINLTLAQLSLVVTTSIASAIGSPGVPGVGIGILATILSKIGVPLEGISLIMGVDRIVDMGCTVVNVAGDLTASKLLSLKKLAK